MVKKINKMSATKSNQKILVAVFILLVLLALIIISPKGQSIVQSEILSILRETTFYDPDGCVSSDGSSSSVVAFDTSKLALYESQAGQEDPGAHWAITEEAKNYALNLGIPPTDIRLYAKAEVENMIMAEVARQFAQLSDKHGSTLSQAQQAILSYQEHESDSFQMFINGPNGSLIPNYTPDEPKRSEEACTDIMSLTNDKFENWGYNKRAAASYDIKYAIYLGVQEHMVDFTNNAIGSGEARWKYTIGYVFLPGEPQCYWTGTVVNASNQWIERNGICRHEESQAAWDKYASFSSGYSDQCGTSATGVMAVVEIAKQEYEKHKNELAFASGSIVFPGSDYTSGKVDHWCAWFVSWVYKQAGLPFSGGDQGGWSIGGVSQLFEYFKNEQIFIALNQGDPRPGDVIIYHDGIKGRHVQIVISYDNATKTVTYIGGNECNGQPGCNYPRSHINQSSFVIGGQGQKSDLVGFGRYK